MTKRKAVDYPTGESLRVMRYLQENPEKRQQYNAQYIDSGKRKEWLDSPAGERYKENQKEQTRKRQERNKELADELKRARRLRRYTQEKLAKELEVPTPTYRNWEKGISRPNSKHLKNISKILEVPLTDFTQHIKK